MPTKTEFDELMTNCEASWTSKPSVSGRLYTGKGEYSNNSIFFPAAGSYASLGGFNTFTLYMSSTTTSGTFQNVYFLEFRQDTQRTKNYNAGFRSPVRVVLAE